MIKQEQKILFQKGVTIDEGIDDDIYSMLIPGESETPVKGCRHTVTNGKKVNLRSPF